MSLTVTVLGCGNSEGTPSAGNDWGRCDPNDPRNRRTRPSIAVQSNTTTLVVDTGPDFRTQINTANITQIDAVLYTHAHSDHINGADDLRSLSKRQNHEPINVYGEEHTFETMMTRFPYQFEPLSPLYPKVMHMNLITPECFGQPITVGDISFVPFAQDHGLCLTLGFRFGNLAYSTDVVDLDEDAYSALQGIETWIVDGAGHYRPKNPAHLTIESVIKMCERIQPKRVYLTHLSVYMDYKTLLQSLPTGFEPAYDGLILRAN